MQYDIEKVGEGDDILDVFPALRRIPEFEKYEAHREKKNKYIKYILLIYSKDSPLVTAHPSIPLQERKEIAALKIGYSRTKQRNTFHNDTVKDLFQLQNKSVMEMALAYLKFQDEMAWAEKVALEESMWEALRIVMTPIKMDKDNDNIKGANLKDALRKQITEMRKRLQALELEIHNDQETRDDMKANKRKATTMESQVMKSIE